MNNATDKDLLFLYQVLSKAVNAFTILIDEAHQVQFYTEIVPDYFTPQKENYSLSLYLPAGIFAAIRHQIVGIFA